MSFAEFSFAVCLFWISCEIQENQFPEVCILQNYGLFLGNLFFSAKSIQGIPEPLINSRAFKEILGRWTICLGHTVKHWKSHECFLVVLITYLQVLQVLQKYAQNALLERC